MSAKSLVKWKMGSCFPKSPEPFGKTRNPSICGKAAVGYARIDAVSVTVISGSNKRIVLSASSWFSGVLPAQASAGTRTATPLSAAASTVVSTQQSGGHAADRDFLGSADRVDQLLSPFAECGAVHHLMASARAAVSSVRSYIGSSGGTRNCGQSLK